MDELATARSELARLRHENDALERAGDERVRDSEALIAGVKNLAGIGGETLAGSPGAVWAGVFRASHGCCERALRSRRQEKPACRQDQPRISITVPSI